MDFLMKLPSLFDILTIIILIISFFAGLKGKKEKKWWHLIFVVVSLVSAFIVYEIVNKDNNIVNKIVSIDALSGIINKITGYVSIEFLKSVVSALLFYVVGILFLIFIPLIGDIIVSALTKNKPSKTAIKTLGIPSVLSSLIAWMFIILPLVVLKPIVNSASKVIDEQFSNVEEGHVEGDLESKISGLFNGENKIGDYLLKQFDSVTLNVDDKTCLAVIEKGVSKAKNCDYVVLSYQKDGKMQDLFGSLASMIENPEMITVIKSLLSAQSLSELPDGFIDNFINGLCWTLITVDDDQVDSLLETLQGLTPLIGELAGESAGTQLSEVLSDFTYDINKDGTAETINLIHFVRDHVKLDSDDKYDITKADIVFNGNNETEKTSDGVYFLRVLISCLLDNQSGSGKVNFCLAMAQQTMFYRLDYVESETGNISCPTYKFCKQVTDTDTEMDDWSAEPAEGKYFNSTEYFYLGVAFFTPEFLIG